MVRYMNSDCSHDSQVNNCHRVKQLLTQHWAKMSLWHGMVVEEPTLHTHTRLQRPRQREHQRGQGSCPVLSTCSRN